MTVVPIPDDWDGTSYCCRVVQWPSSDQWTAILFGLLTWPTKGRFWDGRTGTITDAQQVGRDIYKRNFIDNGGCTMGCIEDLQASLDAIALALSGGIGGNGCCPVPEGATGSISEPSDDVGQPGEPAPPGYGTSPLVVAEKCAMSNWYYQQLILTLAALRDYNVIGWLALGVGAAASQIIAILTAIVSGAFLETLLTQFGSLSAILEYLLDVGNSDFDAIIDALEADQEGFVCALYTGLDIGNTLEKIGEWNQDAFLTGTQDGLVKIILNRYVLAGLFFPKESALAEAEDVVDPIDCGVCGAYVACPFSFQYGTGTFRYDGVEFTVSSVDFGGGVHILNFLTACGEQTCTAAGNWCVEFTATTINTTTTSYNRWIRGYKTDCSTASVGYGTSSPSFPPLDTPLSLSIVELSSDAPFTVTLKINSRVGALPPGTLPTDAGLCS